ncbi:MAG: F0F1 ATP synthase subunit delta [Alphaproteobacteria bacterium]|nr:F0F1 ATP synthase subunit delta [Alphaproteobacteria bacterium]
MQQGIIDQIAARYAAALFALVQESATQGDSSQGDSSQGDSSQLAERVQADMEKLANLLAQSPSFQSLIRSPIIPAAEQAKAVQAILQKLEIGAPVSHFVAVVVKNRRAFALPAILSAYTDLQAKARGEMAAELIVAEPLNSTQEDALKAKLKKAFGKNINIYTKIDPALLGGLIIRAGSFMIDGSLRAKLTSLKQTMHEAA